MPPRHEVDRWRDLCRIHIRAAAAQDARQRPTSEALPPIHVVDGDTVEQNGMRWRLQGLDAPEISRAQCARERELGITAAARLIALLQQRGGRLTPERTRRGKIASGGFGRKLGALTFGDGTSWATIAVAEGFAVAPPDRSAKRHNWCTGQPS